MSGSQGIAQRGAMLTTLGLLSCVAPPTSELAVRSPATTARAEALAREPTDVSPGGMVVRLSFGADVDLDLYVTDPLQETVYYGNTPSRIGGRLERDVRCDSAGARIETVVIDPAPVGRYRVGVDFPERCEGGSEVTDYALRVDLAGEHHEQTGRLSFGVFEPVVLEVIHEAD